MSVKLEFLGAADTVTGSRTLVSFRGQRLLIDCGLFQGDKSVRDRNWQNLIPKPKDLDGVILTHAHIDHSGYLPRLVKEGFNGPVWATEGTTDLCRIMLRDAARLEEETAGYANRSGYSHHKPALPLFTEEDAEQALTLFRPLARHQWQDLAPGLSLNFLRAGHIIGASLVQLAFDLGHGSRILTFSGDLGNDRSYLMRGPELAHDSDAMVLESTYGDRLQPRTSALCELAEVVRRTASRGGVLIIPAFAVGRAQEIIYMLRLIEDRGQIPPIPVVLDSPMAESAMEVCLRHGEDQVLGSAFHQSKSPFFPRHFEVAATTDQSTYVLMREGPMIVVSASGMLAGGRVLHHLKRRLPDSKNTVLFAGYQAEGSKGRFLQEQGLEVGSIRIHHQEVAIEAEIATIQHLSSHADQADLLAYIERMRRLPQRLFVNHGTKLTQKALAEKISAQFGITAEPVFSLREVELW